MLKWKFGKDFMVVDMSYQLELQSSNLGKSKFLFKVKVKMVQVTIEFLIYNYFDDMIGLGECVDRMFLEKYIFLIILSCYWI